MKKTNFLLTILFVVVFLLVSCKTSNDTRVTKNEMSFSPTVISPEKEVGNPGRGFYQWENDPFLSEVPKYDIYKRFSWRQLEISKDIYDFSPIDIKLAELKNGQRFSFRVMALNTCCTAYKNGADVPDYIVNEKRGWFYPFKSLRGSDSIFIPDWNDSELLDRMEKLIQALAKRYDNDQRVGWVENGLYGNWGQWLIYPIQYPNSAGVYDVPPGTPTSDPIMYAPLYAPIMKDPADPSRQKYREGSIESMQRILFAHTNAFKHKQLIQLTANLPMLFEALNINNEIPMGIRRDAWGKPYFNDITKYSTYKPSVAQWTLFHNRWKTAPFYAENNGGSYIDDTQMINQLKTFNVSAIAFGALGRWADLSSTIQKSYLRCARLTGYRYQISQVTAQLNDSTLDLTTAWKNVNMAPSYENWSVQAYIVNPTTGELFSTVTNIPINLKELLNDQVAPIQTNISMLLKVGWKNENLLQLRILVKDSNGYLEPMNMDMVGRNADGSYTLFSIEVLKKNAQLKI